MNKNGERTKLLAVIAVFAMVACALVALAPSAVVADATYTPVGDTELDSTNKDVTVIGSDGKEITTLTFEQALYVLSYTSATGQQYFTDVTLPEGITVDALTGEGQTFEFAAGVYDVVGTSGAWFVSKFVVNADNVTITAAEGAEVTFAGGLLNGANQSPETDLNQGDTIAIMGDNVTIQNVTVMPMFQTTDNSTYSANKAIQVFGDNAVISGVAVTANTLTTQTDAYGGSIYVGSGNSSDITEVTVKDTTVENGIVTFSGLAASNSTDVTLDSVEISVSDYSGGYYAINNSQKIGGNVSASKVAVSIDDSSADLGGILQYAVPGTTVNVDAAMTLSASATVKAGVTLAVGENGSIAASNSATLTVYGTLKAAAADVTAPVYAGSNAEISEGITTTDVDTSDIQTFDALKNAVEGGEEKITITKPIDMTDNLVISGNTEITMSKDGALIGLNGYTITSNGQGSIKEFKVAEGTNDNRGDFAILTLNGSFEISPGSIIVNGQLVDENEILVRNGGTYIVSGSLNGDLTITYDAGNSSGATVLFDDFSLNNSGVLMLDDGITYEVDSEDVAKTSYFYLYGTVIPYVSEGNANAGVTISVDSKNTFRAYAGAQLSSDVLVQPVTGVTDAVIDLSQAQSTLTISQDVMTSVSYGQLQSIVIDGVLSIRNNSTLEIQGDLVISEGTILTIESGSKLVVNGNVATVSVDGTIDIMDDGEFRVMKAEDVAITGTVNSYGTVYVDSTVAIKEGGVVRINEGDESSIEVVNGMTVDAGGELIVSSSMDIDSIANKGTVTLSNAVLTGDSTISLTAAGAVVNIVSVTGADDGTNTAQTYTLTINDNGLEFADSTPTRPHKVTDAADVNSLDFTLNENVGISGIIVSEVVTTENRVMYNNMDISGTVAIIDDRENVTAGDQGVTMKVDVDGPRLQVSEALTLGARITMNVDGDMTVSGTVTAIADGSDITIGNGEITVTGLIQMTEKIDATDKLNAAYYATQANGTTPAYNWYTNFVDAVAANPATVYVYGEVSVLEDVTVPATMTVRIEGSNSVLTVGDDDNRDVTLTISNGANVRGNQITVDGTVYFENKRNDSVSKVISDVRIEGDADRTYTNIYTALANAEAGETVTITSDEVVWLTSNLTIPTGVTLDVPNTKYIGLDAGVTLTVDGTLRTAHPVQVRIDADTVEDDGTFTVGDFDTEAANTTDKKASAIVVNGTFMTMVGFDEYGYDYYAIPGAYYQVIDSNGIYNYVTPVEAAAAVSANATDGQFDIYGTVNSGDVTFTSSDAVDVTVTVKAGAKYTASSITLVGATLETEAAAGTVAAGLFSGTVTVGDASIEAVNVRNMTVESENGLTVTYADVRYDDPKTTTVNPDASLNATAGTVIVDYVDGEMTVDTGATVTVPNVTSGTRNVDGTVTGDLYVDGTVTVSGGQTLTVSGALYVDGTVTVAAATDSATSGNLYVGTNINGDREGTMYVGLDDEFATTGASASVTGTINVPTIYAAAGTTVDAATVEDMETTAYYVEGAVWINAYGDGDIVVSGMENAPVENAFFNNVWQNEAGDAKYALSTAVQSGSTNPAIGAVDAVYAIIDYNVYHIIVLANQAVDDVTVDGNLMTYGMIPAVDSLLNGQIYYGYMITVSAGDHEILYTLANGYSGEGVLSCVSDNATVNGLSFNAAGTPEDKTGISIVLQLSGFEKTGYVPESPDTGSSDDSGMGITDYLLIVLVVLIIVMAIIVAMRLMRS